MIKKVNEEEIETSVFLKERGNDFKGLSGILFSHKKPCQWTTLPPEMDFIFVHNYRAQNPIPPGRINFAKEYGIQECEDGLTLRPFD